MARWCRCGGGRPELKIYRAARRAYPDGGNAGHLHPAGAAPFIEGRTKGANVFDDFGEKEHVFDLLDGWAAPDTPDSYDLENLVSGNKSEFRKRVCDLSGRIAELEAKNTQPPRRLFRCHQSEVLAELDFLLFMCARPSVLRGHLLPLKLLLMDAWAVSLELKAGTLKLSAAKGESFTGNKRGLSPLYALVRNLLTENGRNISTKTLWALLKQHQGGDVIEEITDDENGGEIFTRGKGQPTTFKAFSNEVSKIRQSIPSPD